jgi:AcrR family transcriptional regulator
MSASYHHGDLKAVLLAFAREQLERASLDSLSMREMAKAVGVSHTAAYRHFQDKRALLEAVAVQGFEEMLAAGRTAEDPASSDARAKLKALGLAYVRFGLRHPRRLAHMFNAVSNPEATAELMQVGAQLFELLFQLVREGQQKEVFRAGDARQMTHACWAMVHGLSILLSIGILQTSEVNLNAQMLSAGQSLEVFLDGLGTKSVKI